jgi:chromosome segregation ATPase
MGELEGQPTIVSSVQPKFPPRASELEQRYSERFTEAQEMELENLQQTGNSRTMRVQLETLKGENEHLVKTRDALMLSVGVEPAKVAEDLRARTAEVNHLKDEMGRLTRARDSAVDDKKTLSEQLRNAKTEASNLRMQLENIKARLTPAAK